MDKFQKKGPYTLKAALQVAKMCARSEDWQIGDTLSEVAHKFSPEEFDKLLHWKKHLPEEDHSAWCIGTGGDYMKLGNGRVSANAWRLKRLDEEFSDAHLDIIAGASDHTFSDLLESLDIQYVSRGTRRMLLSVMRIAEEENGKGWKAEYDKAVASRDSSPERN